MDTESFDPIQPAFEPIRPKKRPFWYKALAVISAIALVALAGRAFLFLIASYL